MSGRRAGVYRAHLAVVGVELMQHITTTHLEYVSRVAGIRIHTTCTSHPDFCLPEMRLCLVSEDRV